MLGKNAIFTNRGGEKMAAIVVEEAAGGESAGYTILTVFPPSGGSSTVEAVAEGQDVRDSSGTFVLVE